MKTAFYSALFILCLSASIASAQKKADGEKPNIILIMGDDLSYNDIEPYGNTQVHTPNLAALAREGMCFDNMFTSTAMCAPTRQQLMTGLYPVRNGAYPNHSRVYEGTRSVAHHLQQLGYRTALIGKKHYAPEESFPFQYLGGRDGDNGKGRDIELEKAEAFVLNSKKQPYFLIVASNQPHGPLTRGNASAYPPREIKLNPGDVDTKLTRQNFSKYYAEVTYLDSLAGVCMDIVKKSGKADNTIIIFTSEQGTGVVPFGKWTCYDEGLKTAFIVKWPGMVKPGTRNKALTQYVDVVPTLIDIAGGDPSKFNTGVKDANGFTGFDGRSFQDVLLGKTDRFRDFVYGVHTTRGIIKGSESYPIRSVRNEKYLYIHNLDYTKEFSNVLSNGALFQSWKEKDPVRAGFYLKRPEEELYDVVSDPFQLKNLAEDPALEGVKTRMQAKLASFMKQQGDKGIITEMNAGKRKRKEH